MIVSDERFDDREGLETVFTGVEDSADGCSDDFDELLAVACEVVQMRLELGAGRLAEQGEIGSGTEEVPEEVVDLKEDRGGISCERVKRLCVIKRLTLHVSLRLRRSHSDARSF
jgi:hypothetical protein